MIYNIYNIAYCVPYVCTHEHVACKIVLAHDLRTNRGDRVRYANRSRPSIHTSDQCDLLVASNCKIVENTNGKVKNENRRKISRSCYVLAPLTTKPPKRFVTMSMRKICTRSFWWEQWWGHRCRGEGDGGYRSAPELVRLPIHMRILYYSHSILQHHFCLFRMFGTLKKYGKRNILF